MSNDTDQASLNLAAAIEAVRLLLPWAEVAWDESQEFLDYDEVADYTASHAKAMAVLTRADKAEQDAESEWLRVERADLERRALALEAAREKAD